jgi:tRNA(Ile)-lysidine synthase
VAPVHLEPRHLPLPGRVELPEVGLAVEARIVPATGHGVPRDTGRVVFDADALSGPLGVRGRRRGDRFHPFGSPAERRLKTFLIDAKVPRWERDRVPLVTAGDRIVWVAGVRRAAHAPVVAGTSRVLELVLEPLAQGPPGQ